MNAALWGSIGGAAALANGAPLGLGIGSGAASGFVGGGVLNGVIQGVGDARQWQNPYRAAPGRSVIKNPKRK